MEFRHKSTRWLYRIAAAYLFLMSTAYAREYAEYSFPRQEIQFSHVLGDSSWRVSGNPLRCGLSLIIPNYGVGYFEQYAAQQPHFILRKWGELIRPLPAKIIVRTPVWKPSGSVVSIGKLTMYPGEFSIFLRRNSTLKLLNYLSEGYETRFKYHSELGIGVEVSLTPVGFQKPYSRYQRCLGNLLPFDYAQVRETVFNFPEDSRELTDQDKTQLRRIAQYVAADVQIKVIRIMGYADDRGRKGYNNAISQERAQAVQNYLIRLGVPQEQLSVTWFGELKPIARNDTDAGRATNRRVVVSLIKK